MRECQVYCLVSAVSEAPKRNDATRQRNYKTKEETEKSKTVTSTVVLSLLLIACVVPMLQYYGECTMAHNVIVHRSACRALGS